MRAALPRPSALALCLIAAVACAGDEPPPPSAQARLRPPDPAALHLGGSGALMPLCTRLAEAWQRRGGAPPIVVEESIGTGGGVRAAADGALDLGLVSRPLSEREQALGLLQLPFGRDVVLVAAYPGAPIDGLRGAELLELHRGTRRSYPDGSPAILLLRDRGESANSALDQLVPGLAAAREDAYQRRHLRVLYHDSAMGEALAATPGALGVFPLGAIRAFRLPLKILALDGVVPSPEAVAAGRWRASRELSLVLRPDRLGRASPFLRFALSPEGRAVFDDCGYLQPPAQPPPARREPAGSPAQREPAGSPAQREPAP